MAVQSDDAAAPGPCGHAKVELSDPLRRQLPTPAPLRPASKSVGRFAENWGSKAAQTTPYLVVGMHSKPAGKRPSPGATATPYAWAMKAARVRGPAS